MGGSFVAILIDPYTSIRLPVSLIFAKTLWVVWLTRDKAKRRDANIAPRFRLLLHSSRLFYWMSSQEVALGSVVQPLKRDSTLADYINVRIGMIDGKASQAIVRSRSFLPLGYCLKPTLLYHLGWREK